MESHMCFAKILHYHTWLCLIAHQYRAENFHDHIILNVGILHVERGVNEHTHNTKGSLKTTIVSVIDKINQNHLIRAFRK